MTAQSPSIGRVVNYRLLDTDAEHGERQREINGQHAGNSLEASQVYPAMIVRVFDGSPAVNLQVFLDGNHALWVTSRIEGDEPGQWTWPART